MTTHVLIAVLGSLLMAPATAGAQETVVYYHTDAIGSVRAITDSTGAEIARYDYLPFGELWPVSPPAPAEVRQFAGKERDSNTELDYVGARYYASQTGRFTTVDPGHVGGDIFNPQSWNAYAYALNNPLRFVDPLGMEPCQITLTGADAAAAGIESGGTVQGECVRGRKESSSERLSRNFFGLLDAFLLTAPLQAPGMGQADQPLVDRSPDNAVLAAAIIVPGLGARAAATRSTALLTQAAMTVGNKGAVAASRDAALAANWREADTKPFRPGRRKD